MEHVKKQCSLNNEILTLSYPAPSDADMVRLWEGHEENERMFPYWLESWTSAFGLYVYLREHAVPIVKGLELGCGCGVLAQLLAYAPGPMCHTDLLPEAVTFSRSVGPVEGRDYFCLDITAPALKGRMDLLLAADVLYEDYLVEALVKLVNLHLSNSGVCYIADPGRFGKRTVAEQFENSPLFNVQSDRQEFNLDGKPYSILIHIIKKA